VGVGVNSTGEIHEASIKRSSYKKWNTVMITVKTLHGDTILYSGKQADFDDLRKGSPDLDLERFCKPLQQSANDFWDSNITPLLEQYDPNVTKKFKDTYYEWVSAPIHLKPKRATGINIQSEKKAPTLRFFSMNSDVRFIPTAVLGLHSTQDKFFSSPEALFQALKGHNKAAFNRKKEETLALEVLANFPTFEITAIDAIINKMHNTSVGPSPTFKRPAKNRSAYGLGANIDWGCSDTANVPGTSPLLQGIDAGLLKEPLSRLYKKIAAIHDFFQTNSQRAKKPSSDSDTNGSPHTTVIDVDRGNHHKIRINKYSLDEDDKDVIKDRLNGNSIWAGKSGSTIDIISTAKALGFTETVTLARLAYCTFAFFHYMPTSVSSTHTYHEVMRGAISAHGELQNFYTENFVPDHIPRELSLQAKL
jgi:hypothetical protein